MKTSETMSRENYPSIVTSNQIPSSMKNAIDNFSNDVKIAADKHLKDFVHKPSTIDFAISILENLFVKEYCDITRQKERERGSVIYFAPQDGKSRQPQNGPILEITISDSEDEKTNASQKLRTQENSQPDSDKEKRLTQTNKWVRKRVSQVEPRYKVSLPSTSDSDPSWEQRPMRNQPKRIKTAESDSDSENEHHRLQKITVKLGRRKIHPPLRDDQLSLCTIQAATKENWRLERIAKRQKSYNEIYGTPLTNKDGMVLQLVLDFDEDLKKPLISVEENLAKLLKLRQAHAVKFMWDACFESLEILSSTNGSGCILANCFDPDKSLQIVTLSHTLLSNAKTGVKTILLVCLRMNILTWVNKFKFLLNGIGRGDEIQVYEMKDKTKRTFTNLKQQLQLIRTWHKTGGVMIVSYGMFRHLLEPTAGKNTLKKDHNEFLECLVDPGPNVLICDNGRLLKNTSVGEPMALVKTRRRILLTDTPLQNHLDEYYSMMQFIKPNLLGTRKEFCNRFLHPITNGQFDDSTDSDVKLMLKQTYRLHELLEATVTFAINPHL